MSKSGKYGNRNLSKMLTEWRELKASIAMGDMERAEYWADRCENWIDFSFSNAQKDIAND